MQTQGETKEKFAATLGGGLASTSIHDWKLACIQQIALVINKKYKTVQESFDDASNNKGKVNYNQFKSFIDKHNALEGF